MDFINLWVKQIIVAVIIGTIIELILPNGNCKKFIKIVIGIFILFNIVSPIIDKVSNGKFDISSIINIEKYIDIEKDTTVSKKLDVSNNSNIKNVYISNLKQEIKNRIESKNYTVKYINIELENNDEYKIKSIELTVNKKEENKEENKKEDNNIKVEIEQINKIEISIQENNTNKENKEEDKENNKSNISNKDKKELKEYLNSTYEIKIENIIIN